MALADSCLGREQEAFASFDPAFLCPLGLMAWHLAIAHSPERVYEIEFKAKKKSANRILGYHKPRKRRICQVQRASREPRRGK